ncbi:MAG: class I SAM-dependent methyltransferase [Proteobacteria bacterium]|uniref:class I SAM-dependent methyltransferase n=1 Tax=Rudaea sp. TaxID=2136325 RepID=UPI0037836404|nr:class I SAM-dependent methyltransferase [Pseudomonadota bacterium]
MISETRQHWERVHREKDARAASWFRPHLDTSLRLLQRAGLDPYTRVIDVGGGTSTLVDDLLDRGVTQVSVLDLSETALEVARRRLGERAARVEWRIADITHADLPPAGFDLWHDRAVLHFLIGKPATDAYVGQAATALRGGGHAVIGGFAGDGPERCSGLPVARREAEDIAALFATHFELIDQAREMHSTPWGTAQSFAYALLRRRGGGATHAG